MNTSFKITRHPWWRQSGLVRVVVPIRSNGLIAGYSVEAQRRGEFIGRVAVVWHGPYWSWRMTKAVARELATHPHKLRWAADGLRVRDLRHVPAQAVTPEPPRRPANLDQQLQRRFENWKCRRVAA